MASAKQIAWRKKFARMAKSGKYRSAKKEVKKNVLEMDENKRITLSSLDRHMKDRFKGKSDAYLRRIIRTKKGNTDDEGYELGRRMRLGNSKRDKLLEQQREPTRQEFKRAGYSESEIDDYFNRKWDKKMQEFLNKSNNES